MSNYLPVPTLKKRWEFLRLQKEGCKWIASAFVIQSSPYKEAKTRIGYITTRKLGTAVVRNRIRRRLKALVRSVFPNHALLGYDYVIIARASCLRYDFLRLERELIWSLSHLHRLHQPKIEQQT